MKRNAILTAVPARHLDSALRDGGDRVLFGSKLWELFESRDTEPGMPVLIYASHPEFERQPGEAQVSWEAVYQRYWRAEEINWEIRRLRPQTTDSDTEEEWPGFYEVTALRKLPEEEWTRVSTFSKADGSSISPTFIPHGPIVVRA